MNTEACVGGWRGGPIVPDGVVESCVTGSPIRAAGNTCSPGLVGLRHEKHRRRAGCKRYRRCALSAVWNGRRLTSWVQAVFPDLPSVLKRLDDGAPSCSPGGDPIPNGLGMETCFHDCDHVDITPFTRVAGTNWRARAPPGLAGAELAEMESRSVHQPMARIVTCKTVLDSPHLGTRGRSHEEPRSPVGSAYPRSGAARSRMASTRARAPCRAPQPRRPPPEPAALVRP